MTKEEKIQEAYGEYWELIKDSHTQEGWIKDDEKGLRYKLVHEIFKNQMDIETTSFNTRVRLKSLQGIENNNGWIKIESEYDLPKTPSFYWVTSANFYPTECHYSDIKLGYHTHYQAIVKPQPPLY